MRSFLAKLFSRGQKPRKRFDRNRNSGRRSISDISNWRQEPVGEHEEHLVIRYGSIAKNETTTYPIIARVGRPGQHKFPVEVLCDNEEQRKALQRQLGFYLNELPADRGILSLEDIWDYQR